MTFSAVQVYLTRCPGLSFPTETRHATRLLQTVISFPPVLQVMSDKGLLSAKQLMLIVLSAEMSTGGMLTDGASVCEQKKHTISRQQKRASIYDYFRP